MDNKTLGELLVKSLSKYGFKNYGSKLFYLELKDSIVILEQLTYLGCAELYLRFIIKECHQEINKITKSILKDEMIIDSYDFNKLLYKTLEGYRWNFYDIPVDEFEFVIRQLYNDLIKPFEIDYINGINNYNKFAYKELYGFQAEMYKDTAEKINRPDLAAYRGHDWLISDWYILVNKYNIDNRFVNSNTEKYILERVIPNIPENLKGKEISKWCNERCKEIFISKKRRRDFGYGIVFPFINGKPLKFDGIDGQFQIYVNDETSEVYRCKVTDKTDLNNIKYEIHKVK